jgi:hypothetical protein
MVQTQPLQTNSEITSVFGSVSDNDELSEVSPTQVVHLSRYHKKTSSYAFLMDLRSEEGSTKDRDQQQMQSALGGQQTSPIAAVPKVKKQKCKLSWVVGFG